MTTQTRLSGTNQLKKRVKELRAKNKSINLKEFQKFVIERNPMLNNPEELEHLRNVFYTRTSDLELTLLLEELINQKDAA